MGEKDNLKNEIAIFMRIDNDFVRKKHVILSQVYRRILCINASTFVVIAYQ